MYHAMPEGEKPSSKEEWQFASHVHRYGRWITAQKRTFKDVEFTLESLINVEMFDLDDCTLDPQEAWEYGYIVGFENLAFWPFWYSKRRAEFDQGLEAGELDRISGQPYCPSDKLQF